MKKQITILTLCFVLFFVACNNSNTDKATNGKEKTEAKVADEDSSAKEESRDTTYYFAKRLLNSSPKEVEKVLGKPDSKIKQSKDCDHLIYPCLEAKYQNGKFEVLYSNNLLKWITINNIVGVFYDENAVEFLNFPKSIPTKTTEHFIWWQNYGGIKNIAFVKEDSRYLVKYIMIQVDEFYDKKFDN